MSVLNVEQVLSQEDSVALIIIKVKHFLLKYNLFGLTIPHTWYLRPLLIIFFNFIFFLLVQNLLSSIKVGYTMTSAQSLKLYYFSDSLFVLLNLHQLENFYLYKIIFWFNFCMVSTKGRFVCILTEIFFLLENPSVL